MDVMNAKASVLVLVDYQARLMPERVHGRFNRLRGALNPKPVEGSARDLLRRGHCNARCFHAHGVAFRIEASQHR